MRRSVPAGVAPPAGGLPAAARAALGGRGGRPLDLPVRAEMESRFGQDLGGIRIHTDQRAGEAADSLGALAFTLGDSIWFGPAQYQPGTRPGRHLLAHELAHALQQRGEGPSPQARPKVGDVRDPAEATADRAADAVMRDEPVPPLGAAPPALRRQPRPFDARAEADRASREQSPQVTGTTDPEAVTVEYRRQRYGARRRVTGWREECEMVEVDEPARLRADFDRSNAWAQVEWCSAGGRSTRGRIRLGADIPAALGQAVSDVVRGGRDPRDALRRMDLTPFLEVDIARSGQVRVTGRAETTVNPASGDVRRGGGSIGVALPGAVIEFNLNVTAPQGAGGRPEVQAGLTLTVELGERPQHVECRRVQVCRYHPQYVVECEQVTGGEPVQAPPRDQYLYFEYAAATVATRNTRSTGTHRQENLRGAAENDREIAEIGRLLDQGWQVKAIEGFTSPEGPEQQEVPGGFIGNQPLSDLRAAAARDFVDFLCNPALSMRRRACFVERPDISGGGELLTARNPVTGRGLGGPDLARQATPRFLQSPDEARHRTPALEQQLARAGPQQQASLMWPLLRRAKITFTRTETPPVRRQPLDKCPASVEAAVRAFFDARRGQGLRR